VVSQLSLMVQHHLDEVLKGLVGIEKIIKRNTPKNRQPPKSVSVLILFSEIQLELIMEVLVGF
jgi:hypothetical protein